MTSNLLHEDKTYRIIGACMEVHKKLGPGFLESVYQEALEIEFINNGVPFRRQERLNIYYNGKKLDKYFIADFVCYGIIILEIKAVEYVAKPAEQQVVNYLKSTGLELGLLINFGGKSLTWKRFINTNPRNPYKSV